MSRGKRYITGVMVTAMTVSVTVAGASAPAIAAQAPSGATAKAGKQVTLISGDVVTVAGESAIVAERRPGVDYRVRTKAGKLLVVPSDAEPALRTGLIDESLFDVKYLVDNGYADADRDTLPMIASYTDKGKRLDSKSIKSKAAALPAARATHTLDSIGAQAVDVDKHKAGDLWKSVTSGKAGVQRLSLDRKVKATLAESVPQVKAPQAWAAGYDGTGVKVAVLDTGADATHPDLAGRITTATSFVPGEQDNVDHNGHGTHVASTVAGSGAASGGQRKGVAPGARLAIGKVLDGAGSGQESWIIDGMQWAATTAQAKVISMSLGGGPTDGTDSLSQAVDSITAQTGALFVIAAGNSGPGAWKIGTPGAAASALTVGAVNKSDVMASFSSRGPRIDGAAKPEIAAPGVSIVAARATGTSMGTPVDQNYTSADGTSMATPHVAGEAAILAQRNPTWTGAQLKAGIVGSADDLGKPADSQGAGRINAQRAIAETVLASPAAVGFGNIDPSATGNQVKTVTYNNKGTSAVTLSFSARLTDAAGVTAPAGSLSLSHTSLAVPAGGNATLTLTINPTNLVKNVHYSGVVTATGAGSAGTVITPIAASKVIMRTVTLRVLGFDGQPAFSNCGSFDIYCLSGDLFLLDAGGGSQSFPVYATAAAVTVQVPDGTYSVDLAGRRPSDPDLVEASIAAIKPQIVIDSNKEILFDLRDLKKVTEQTTIPSTRTGSAMYYKRTSASGGSNGLNVWSSEHSNLYMNPTESVTIGTLDHQYQSTRIRSLLDIAVGSSTFYPRYYFSGSVGGTGNVQHFTGQQQKTVVYGGAGSASFFSGTNVTGKVVLIEHAGTENLRTVVDRAIAGGASGVVTYSAVAVLKPDANDGAHLIPLGYLTKTEGLAFKAALPGGSAQSTVSGYPEIPSAYHLAYDTIPANPTFVVQNNTMTTVFSAFHAKDPTARYSSIDAIRRGVTGPMLSLSPGLSFVAPANRTDYYGPATPWLVWERITNTHEATGDALWTTDNVFNSPATSQTEKWNRTPKRLGQAQWNLDIEGHGSYYLLSRQGNTFYPVPQLLDGSKVNDHGGMPQLPDGNKVQIGLKRNGQTVTGRTEDGMTVYDVPGASDSYEMSLKYQPNGTASGVYRVESTYGFTSQQATQEESTLFYMCGLDRKVTTQTPAPCENQKVDIIDYDIVTDLDNAIPVGVQRAAFFQFQPLKGAPTVSSMQVSISYNEGASWQALSLVDMSGGNYGTILTNPQVGNASLKVSATDSAGSTVTETLYNAYRIK